MMEPILAVSGNKIESGEGSSQVNQGEDSLQPINAMELVLKERLRLQENVIGF